MNIFGTTDDALPFLRDLDPIEEAQREADALPVPGTPQPPAFEETDDADPQP